MTAAQICGWSGGGLFLLLTLIQFSPLKVNPWSYIAKKIGSAINSEIHDKLDSLEKKIEDVDKKTNSIVEKEDMRNAIQCRSRILRFGDELRMQDNRFSKEHFDSVLLDIDDYQKYCDKHQDFKNHVTVFTIQKIEEEYKTLLDNNGFLV